MKKYFLFLLVAIATAKLPAQTNAPIGLALISDSDEANPAADVLTAQLSASQNIHLLERDEIEKVYHEQGMSAANRDDLKLGRILGADGLLLLDIVRTPQTTNLTMRLIAVKPGVVLTDGSFPWPQKDVTQWAESVMTYLNSFLPKLTVLAKDAIPISIVNLRAAVASTDEQEMERDLKLLTIQRLSQEQQLFVLERQKMQLLSNEKELKSDESAFWNGSYLLDGIIDQNGYSKGTVTIDARLTPPKGGMPLSFEVSGSRTNLSEVINRLAAKVTELLKVNSTVPEWSSAKEATQYFEDAKWALRWGIFSEAQAAADSAWALGKHDVDCAIVRIRAYETPLHSDTYQNGEFTNPGSNRAVIQMATGEAAPNPPWGLTLRDQNYGGTKVVQYVFAAKFPDPERIEIATHALELYSQFSRNSPDNLLKVGSQETGWANSEWYNLGIEDLVAASMVLQEFNFVPEAQKSVTDKLADLRALARSVANWISESPSVHDSYFVGDRIVTHDELANTMNENPNIFHCEVNWGCFWQERPEDTVQLYRGLMHSPVFSYIQKDLWLRPLEQPRLVAWSAEDKKRIQQLWNSFVQELGASSNVFWQLEAKAFQLADANDEQQMAASFTNLFDTIFKNQDALVNNNVEVLYLDWGTGDLVSAEMGNGIATDTRQSLNHLFYSEYWPKLQAMDQEYWNKTMARGQEGEAFEKQKQYLKENRPYDFFEFVHTFSNGGAPDYSKAQALEIEPLLEAYKSNLVAQSKSASGMRKGQLMSAIAQVDFVENDVNRSLHPPEPQLRLQPKPQAPQPALALKVAAAVPVATPAPEIANNVIEVDKFIPIPRDRVIELGTFERISPPGIDITVIAHHWVERKLFLDFQYRASVDLLGENGRVIGGRNVAGSAIAIFNPDTESWDMVNCPEISEISLFELRIKSANNRLALFHGDLFSCENGPLQKFDFQKREWRNLEIPEQDGYDLFTVAGHLFATDDNTILEITDGGQGTRILASTRRRPVKSALDSLDNLGSPSPLAGGKPLPPELFSVSDHSICASIGNKIFSWDGNDWHELSTPNLSQPPEIFQDAIIFRSSPAYGSDGPANLWLWEKNQSVPELALSDGPKPHPHIINFRPSEGINPTHEPGEQTPHPLWKSPAGNYLTDWAATFYQTNLYFFVDHCIVTNVSGHWTVAEKNGYHAQLVCLSRDVSRPIIVPLKFDLDHGQPPLKSLGEQIEPELAFSSSALATAMYFSRNTLFLSQRNTPGIWAIPISQIETAIAEQKQACLAEMAQEAKQASTEEEQQRKVLEQQHRDLLTRYDLNHNGRIDPEEREAALGDPAFIRSELDAIDANHNGLLDPEELACFDPDNNKILEPNEQTGIDIAWHLLAERLLKKFDADGNGTLDQSEFDNLQANLKTKVAFMTEPSRNSLAWDDNHDGVIDSGELESSLKQQLRSALRPRGAAAAAFFRQLTADPNTAIDPRHMFKAEVEFYWQNSASPANETPAPNPHGHVP
jgi:Ca2+-binding EF-hand superfamily protein